MIANLGSSIMPRKAAEFWWNLTSEKKVIIPADVSHYIINGDGTRTPITWQKVLAERKEKQKDILDCINKSEQIKACYIWVFLNKNTTFFGGWWIYIKTLKKDYSINFRHERNDNLILKAMKMFPCGVFPLIDNFDTWAEKFAAEYHKECFGRKRQGIKACFCKISENESLIDIDNSYNNLNP